MLVTVCVMKMKLAKNLKLAAKVVVLLIWCGTVLGGVEARCGLKLPHLGCIIEAAVARSCICSLVTA